MRLPRLFKNSLLPLLLVLAAQKVVAQLAPADDFFNGGAQLYISNNIPAALEKTEAGLKIYPDDEKLKKLEELLKQKQQSQSQQNQQQNQQNKSQSQNDQSQSKQNQNSSGQKNPQNQQDEKNQNQQSPENQKNQPDKNEPPKNGGEKSPEQKPDDGNQPSAPDQMTSAEAKQLLDAQKGNEQLLKLKPPGKPENSSAKIKDW